MTINTSGDPAGFCAMNTQNIELDFAQYIAMHCKKYLTKYYRYLTQYCLMEIQNSTLPFYFKNLLQARAIGQTTKSHYFCHNSTKKNASHLFIDVTYSNDNVTLLSMTPL